jgi:TPR repeat protein
MTLPRICLLLLLVGCQRARSSPPPDEEQANVPAGRVDVVSRIVTCSTLAECERDCAADRADGCAFAGRFYEFGHGVVADSVHSFRLYDRSCTLGSVIGCYNAALLLEAGSGVARDPGRALMLYGELCGKGSATACAHADAMGAGRR